MTDKKIKGLTTELLCQYYITSLGYNISIPLGEDCKYDLIADFDVVLTRIQIKSCLEKENGILINLRSVSLSSENPVIRTYSKNDIDFFGTFYKDNMYLIPVEECGTSSKLLSFNSSKYSSSKETLLSDCKAELQIEKILNGELFLEQEQNSKVFQYDLKGHLISNYDSYCDAARAIGKRKEAASHIAQVCKGKRKTAYGYIWKGD
ncbi:MAG: hypothetical protein HFH72_08710 [Lachnospiraceae bacterium]|nr:hypothetical protein [Lachnospiraceae bacterium]